MRLHFFPDSFDSLELLLESLPDSLDRFDSLDSPEKSEGSVEGSRFDSSGAGVVVEEGSHEVGFFRLHLSPGSLVGGVDEVFLFGSVVGLDPQDGASVVVELFSLHLSSSAG